MIDVYIEKNNIVLFSQGHKVTISANITWIYNNFKIINNVFLQCFGIYGIIHYDRCDYLILVTKSKKIGRIVNKNKKETNDVFEIKEVNLIPLNDSCDLNVNEVFINETQNFFKRTPGIYFSEENLCDLFGQAQDSSVHKNHSFFNTNLRQTLYDKESSISEAYSEVFNHMENSSEVENKWNMQERDLLSEYEGNTNEDDSYYKVDNIKKDENANKENNVLKHNNENNKTLNYEEKVGRDIFLFNKHQITAFVKKYETNTFIIKCIQGYYTNFRFENKKQHNISFFVSFISRRAINRLGTRLQCRGAVDGGACANMVETEFAVFNAINFNDKNRENIKTYEEDKYTYFYKIIDHFKIIRGTIPLKWHQNVGFKYTPKIIVEKENSLCVFDKHHKMLECLYELPILYINLINRANKSEKEIFIKYSEVLRERKCLFINFNFHDQEIYSYEIEKITKELQIQDKMQIITIEDLLSIIDFNKCIARVNCIDSLDRTNAFQFKFFMHKLHDLYSNTSLIEENIEMLKKMWIENGKFISLQYAGTGALHSEKIKNYVTEKEALITKENERFMFQNSDSSIVTYNLNINIKRRDKIKKPFSILQKSNDFYYSLVRYFKNRTVDYQTNEIYKILSDKRHDKIKKRREYCVMGNKNLLFYFFAILILLGSFGFYKNWHIFQNTKVNKIPIQEYKESLKNTDSFNNSDILLDNENNSVDNVNSDVLNLKSENVLVNKRDELSHIRVNNSKILQNNKNKENLEEKNKENPEKDSLLSSKLFICVIFLIFSLFVCVRYYIVLTYV